MTEKGNQLIRFAIVFLTLLAVSAPALAETKLDYRQREAMRRQEWNMKDVDKKLAAGVSGDQVQWLQKKLDAILADLAKNNCPDENSQVTALKERVAKARKTLESLSTAKAAEAAPAAAPSAAPAAAAPQPATPRAQGKPAPKPAEAKQAPVPKLPYGAMQAVNRQWRKVQQEAANLRQLWADVEAASVIKKWNDRNIEFSLSGVQSDLDKNHVPPDHPYYQKIMNGRANILQSLAKLKTIAQPKIDAYANATNPASYPNLREDTERAESLTRMYRNVSVSNLQNPAKAKKLLAQAEHVERFIADSRKTYAPLLENKIAAATTLGNNLIWLERGFDAFKKVRASFDQQAPAHIKQMLERAEKMMAKAKAMKNPQFFTGGVAQAMGQASGLLESLTLSKGKDDATVVALNQALEATRQKSDETAKALEEEILAETKAPQDAYKGSGRSSLIKQMKAAWEKNNPDDDIMDVRILSNDWERSTGYEWNNAYNRWDKYDRQVLNMVVIVKTDSKIATIYPAFINRDNMKHKEWEVAQHDTKYVVRRMLVRNFR
jgi:hypothetical protein